MKTDVYLFFRREKKFVNDHIVRCNIGGFLTRSIVCYTEVTRRNGPDLKTEHLSCISPSRHCYSRTVDVLIHWEIFEFIRLFPALTAAG